MLLAIDTSAGTSVAVVDRDGGMLAERTETDTMRHAEVIGELIRGALPDAGVGALGTVRRRRRDGARARSRACASASPRRRRSRSGPASR